MLYILEIFIIALFFNVWPVYTWMQNGAWNLIIVVTHLSCLTKHMYFQSSSSFQDSKWVEEKQLLIRTNQELLEKVSGNIFTIVAL